MRHAVDISRCCRDDMHSGCTGCDCACHEVPAAALHEDGLRGLIEQHKTTDREEASQ